MTGQPNLANGSGSCTPLGSSPSRRAETTPSASQPMNLQDWSYDHPADAVDLVRPGALNSLLLRFLRACREAKIPGRPGPNVVTLSGRRMDQYAATTINRRLVAITGLFAFAAMRDPELKNPVPKGREARWRVAGERSGMLAHTVRRPK